MPRSASLIASTRNGTSAAGLSCQACACWHTEMVRAIWLLTLCGCAAPGLLTDGTSVSVGTFASGILRHGAKLPGKGEGYIVQPLWASRNSSYGTDELVAAIQHVARRVRREYPG